MSKSDRHLEDEWGPIGGQGDHSASSYNSVRESVEILGWDADSQYGYLVEGGLPTIELLEQFFDVVPGFLPFLIARGRLDHDSAEALVKFEQFLTEVVCPKPWGDERDALEDPRWASARNQAAQTLALLPPSIAPL
jgi:hypothetical protein